MIIEKREYHQMTSTLTYDICEDDIIEAFGSIENFTDNMIEHSDEFYEFMMDHDYDREDDLWTDRKGGYDVDWDIVDES